MKKYKDCAFMVEEVFDDKDNISQFEPEGTSDKSWFEEEIGWILKNLLLKKLLALLNQLPLKLKFSTQILLLILLPIETIFLLFNLLYKRF